MNDTAWLKRAAAERATALVDDGMRIGLGSGTTAEEFIRALAPRLRAGLRIEGVASSSRSERLAHEVRLPLVELTGELDLAVDGADAIERGSLSAIKGLGGALTREKLIASAARRFLLIGDETKLVDRLTDASPRVPVPVEVLQFGWQWTAVRLAAFGTPVVRERDGAPFVTDNGNLILDLFAAQLNDPLALADALSTVPGVVEHGLFIGMATLAIVGSGEGIIELIRDA